MHAQNFFSPPTPETGTTDQESTSTTPNLAQKSKKSSRKNKNSKPPIKHNFPPKIDPLNNLEYLQNLPTSKGYVDVHCHLAASEFDSDRDEVIQAAKNAGVAAVIVVAEGPDCFEKILDLQEKYPDFIFACLGCHPIQGDYCDVEKAKSLTPEYLEKFGRIDFITKNVEKLSGIGEIGLDSTLKYTPNGAADRDLQRAALRTQVQLASTLNLPINLHSRSAGKPLFEVLDKEFPEISGVFHAYAGKPSLIPFMTKKNPKLYFSAGTNRVCVESDNAEKFTQAEKFFKNIPYENVLLETDAPALGPFRGERNEPKNVVLAAESFARSRGLDVGLVKNLTSFNACKLFPKLRRVLY